MSLISVIMPKGGNGKSSLANAVSRSLNAFYSTNDPINSFLYINHHPKVLDKITDSIIAKDTVVFDAGGFIDKTISEVIKKSDAVIIPVEFSNSSIMTLDQIFNEISAMNSNIFIVANKIEKDKDFQAMREILNEMGIKDERIIRIRKSRIFEAMLEENKSIEDFYNDSMSRNRYKDGIFNDYFKLLEVVK